MKIDGPKKPLAGFYPHNKATPSTLSTPLENLQITVAAKHGYCVVEPII